MRKARIFIVEDEIVIVRGLEEALRRFGCKVCGFAFSGEDALDMLANHKPDLVLIDIYLRGKMDGIELAQEIRSRFQIPVIYITAYSNQEVIERAKVTDPYGYIVKPLRDRQLKVNVELALERSRQERQRKAEVAQYLRVNEDLERQLEIRCDEVSSLAERRQEMEKRIGQYQRRLDELRQQLTEVNQALTVLTQHMEKTRADVELEVAAAIRLKVMPILRQLESDPSLKKCQTEFDMLKLHMLQLSSGLTRANTWCTALSTTELRISTLIQQGCTSEEIADRLHVSLDTVKTHRKRIRRKFNLQNTSTSLAGYLRSQLDTATCSR